MEWLIVLIVHWEHHLSGALLHDCTRAVSKDKHQEPNSVGDYIWTVVHVTSHFTQRNHKGYITCYVASHFTERNHRAYSFHVIECLGLSFVSCLFRVIHSYDHWNQGKMEKLTMNSCKQINLKWLKMKDQR